jgi:hypothetical protein
MDLKGCVFFREKVLKVETFFNPRRQGPNTCEKGSRCCSGYPPQEALSHNKTTWIVRSLVCCVSLYEAELPCCVRI